MYRACYEYWQAGRKQIRTLPRAAGKRTQRRLALARFEDERFEGERVELVLLRVDDFVAALCLRVVFLAAVFLVVRPPLLFEAVFFLRGFSGISAPERRASLRPIAMACFGFLTLPPRPLFNS